MYLDDYENVRHLDQKGEWGEMVVVIYECTDTVRAQGPITEREDGSTRQKIHSQNTVLDPGSSTSKPRCYRLAAVGLGLLCVLLLTAIILLWINFNNLNKERDQLQTRYTNLTAERDQLETRYNNMTQEREQVKTSCNYIRNEMDRLQKEKVALKVLLNAGWNYFNSSFYYLSTEKKSWSDSRKYCLQRQADLVIIKTRDELEFLDKKFGNVRAWIGLTDQDAEGVWKWVDGSKLTNSFWNKGEPNNLEDEDCVEVLSYYEKAWNDRKCSTTLSWICEKAI